MPALWVFLGLLSWDVAVGQRLIQQGSRHYISAIDREVTASAMSQHPLPVYVCDLSDFMPGIRRLTELSTLHLAREGEAET